MAGGWTHLHFNGMFGPLASIALAVGAGWWAVLLYIDAFVSPLGTAFIYATASPRITMAAGEMGNAPRHLIRLNRQGVPWVGLIVAYLVGVIFFFPFPSWQKLVTAVSLITVLSYGIGPVILLSLRRSLPDIERPFRLKAVRTISALAFIAANWIIYWTGYETVVVLFIFVAVYVVGYLAWHLFKHLTGNGKAMAELDWKHAWWLLPYFAGMWLISYLGPASNSMGGVGAYGFFTGMWILAGFSVVILVLAVMTAQGSTASQLADEKVRTLGSRGEEIVRTAEETGP